MRTGQLRRFITSGALAAASSRFSSLQGSVFIIVGEGAGTNSVNRTFTVMIEGGEMRTFREWFLALHSEVIDEKLDEVR